MSKRLLRKRKRSKRLDRLFDCIVSATYKLEFRVIKSKVRVGHLASVLSHRPHPFANLETRSVFQPQIQVTVHYLVFSQFIPLPNQRLVFAHNALPLEGRISETRDCSVESRLTSFILSSQQSTKMSRHF